MKKIKAIIILFVLVSFISCQQAPTEKNVQTHTHVSKSFTSYSENLELFAEIDAFTKGHGSKFLIHLTNLNTYKPIVNGKVIISVKGTQTDFTSSIDAPLTPGIYQGKFVASIIEHVTLTIIYEGAELNERFDLGEFQVFADDHEAEESFAANAEEHNGEEIIFTKEQVWATDFGTIELQPMHFNTVIPVSGQLEALPLNISSVFAPTDGIISFAQNLVPGQKIKKGDVLFIVDPGQLTSNNLTNRYNSAKAAYEKAKSDMERAEKLIGQNIISEKDFQQIKYDFENTRLNFESIGKNFTNGQQVIKASQSGILSELMINGGDFVNEGQQMGKIINTSRLLLKANLPQDRFGEAGNIISANFRTTSSSRLYTTKELNGKLLSYSITPSNDNAYFPLFFEIDNPGDLTVRLFAEIFLESKTTKEVLSIPISALIESEGHFHVYVQEDGEGYTSRDVKIGSNNGINVIVLEGIQAGDRIVTKGAYRIKLASLAGELPSHGHVH